MHLYDDEQFKSVLRNGMTESVRQIGVYELDLVKLGYFGWINCLSLGLSFWNSQFRDQRSVNAEKT